MPADLSSSRSMAPRLIDLFAGPGGWDYAAQQMGLSALGIELDDAAVDTRIQANLPTVQEDVAALDPKHYRPLDGTSAGLIASPPCQAWSTAGKRGGERDRALCVQALKGLDAGFDMRAELREQCEDARSMLVVEPFRWALALEPEWIALEQVPAVFDFWDLTGRLLWCRGYSVWHGILNAADYGVPQTRKRAVLIASKSRLLYRPDATHAAYTSLWGEKQWVTMDEALGLDHGTVNTRGNRKTSGGNEFSTAQPSWTLTSKARSWKLHTNRGQDDLGRRQIVSTDRPAPTVTGKSGGQWHRVDAEGRRHFTIEELSILQGFPADYPWQGTRTKQCEQIGNAVPPPLARAVLSQVVEPAEEMRDAA